jgi:hypothetical protein
LLVNIGAAPAASVDAPTGGGASPAPSFSSSIAPSELTSSEDLFPLSINVVKG